MTDESGFKAAGWPDDLCQVIAANALRLNSRAGTEGSTMSSLNCDLWLILGLEALSHYLCPCGPLITDDVALNGLVGHNGRVCTRR